ncbi:hypothetical protein T492DRAFT_1075953 [Pavlovales sp. CCMP2436]|nr:hypothetical protein T492DRAFT_1075953 [Pavlovales sp. CCMP2436]
MRLYEFTATSTEVETTRRYPSALHTVAATLVSPLVAAYTQPLASSAICSRPLFTSLRRMSRPGSKSLHHSARSKQPSDSATKSTAATGSPYLASTPSL